MKRFTVEDDNCIACGLCQERAPDNIDLDDDGTVARVTRQPTSDDELEACQEAADFCPTGGLAIDEAYG